MVQVMMKYGYSISTQSEEEKKRNLPDDLDTQISMVTIYLESTDLKSKIKRTEIKKLYIVLQNLVRECNPLK